jgi:hypothetical protein
MDGTKISALPGKIRCDIGREAINKKAACRYEYLQTALI